MFYAHRNISLGAGLSLVVRDEWKDTVGWLDEFTLIFKFLGFKPRIVFPILGLLFNLNIFCGEILSLLLLL